MSIKERMSFRVLTSFEVPGSGSGQAIIIAMAHMEMKNIIQNPKEQLKTLPCASQEDQSFSSHTEYECKN
jgi:hypothetical protein